VSDLKKGFEAGQEGFKLPVYETQACSRERLQATAASIVKQSKVPIATKVKEALD